MSEERKFVLNPAAAYFQKFHKDLKRPQYQTDKIIIPTRMVTKSKTSPASKDKLTVRKEQPTFFTKSYSCAPNSGNVRGILGVEYIVKILKTPSDNSPRFECGLCELVLDSFGMQCHLEGYTHRLKYCQKHFPTAVRHYRQYVQGVPEQDMFKVMAPILAKLAIAIEKHHGRNLPYECYERDFSLNRHQILAKAFSCRHASEQSGPTFTHVIDSKEIQQMVAERHKHTSAFVSRGPIIENNSAEHLPNNREESVSFLEERCTYPNQKKAERQVDNIDVHDIPNKNSTEWDKKCGNELKRQYSTAKPSSAKRRTISPVYKDRTTQNSLDLVDQQISDVEERFKGFREDPESYPYYNEEWQKFWKRRKDELISAGIDHHKHNYQYEWIEYIEKRLNELYDEEMEIIKFKYRECIGSLQEFDRVNK